MKCIYIFRRDLRLTDNIGLINTLKKYKKILPIFIYDVNQIKSPHASVKFLEYQEAALVDLNEYLVKKGSRLCKFYGTPRGVLEYLIKEYKPNAVAFNLDYSNYSIQRDKILIETAKSHNIEVDIYHDLTMRLKFHKAFHEFIKQPITVVVHKNRGDNYDKKFFIKEKLFYTETTVSISRKDALTRIKKEQQPYGISVHLKLGLISTREVYVYSKKYVVPYLTKQMLWREFYFSCWLAHSNNYTFYDERFKNIQWKDNPKERLALWTGKTGYDYIDASINELNATGFMPNRNRMVVAFFSIKIMHINPFLYGTGEDWDCGGQQYFSRKLIDCCYANNTGNWHWAASDTVDVSGMRFNRGFAGRPFKIEPKGEEEYIKKWVKKSRKKIVDSKLRYEEWRSWTSG